MKEQIGKRKENGTAKSMSGSKSLLFALLLGFVAFVLFWANGQRSKRELERILGNRQEVVVAAGEILPGREITLRQIRTDKLYAMTVQPGALSSADRVVNRIAQVPIKEGQQILETMLYEESGGYLSLRVNRQEPRRAITLKMDGEGMLAGLLTPGDYVDIMGVFESTASAGEGDTQLKNHATILAQAVKVLAVDNMMSEFATATSSEVSMGSEDRRGSGAKSSALITVEVTPEQAWELGLAAQIAHMRCLLRHRMNREEHNYTPLAPGRLQSIDSARVFGAGGVSIQVMRPVEGNYSP